MAIVKVTGGGGGLERRVGLKAAKKAAKHAIEKHAAKKGPGKKAAKKQADKHAGKKAAKKSASHESSDQRSKLKSSTSGDERASQSELLDRAFHHLQRAGALVSLLEPETGGDLKQLLEYGIELYKAAAQPGAGVNGRNVVLCAVGLLRASEHLAMAGLYSARTEFRVRVTPPESDEIRRHLVTLVPRMERLPKPGHGQAERLQAMAKELLRRTRQTDGSDPHLDFELAMVVEGLVTALEEGL